MVMERPDPNSNVRCEIERDPTHHRSYQWRIYTLKTEMCLCFYFVQNQRVTQEHRMMFFWLMVFFVDFIVFVVDVVFR